MVDEPKIISKIEREYISFLYNHARRTSSKLVIVSEIEEFIQTEEGQKGLLSFENMKKSKQKSRGPVKIGDLL